MDELAPNESSQLPMSFILILINTSKSLDEEAPTIIEMKDFFSFLLV
jgi:hypothetical protein